MKSSRALFLICAALSLLLIPLVAMQFSDEVQWSPFDFAVMGAMLIALSVGVEVVLRMVRATLGRVLLVGAVVLVFLLVWAEVAVGVFGTPLAGS